MSMCLAVALGRFVILGGAGSALSLVLSWGRRLDIRPGLFMGSLGAIYSLTSCLLRLRGPKQPWHESLAALIAGPTLAFWPSPRLALYVVCRCVELAYQRGEASGLLPSASDEASSVLFAICSGVLLTVGVLQPHLVRPSYRAFIDRVSGYRMRFINVPAIATLGYGTTSLVPGGSEIPELNPRFLSRKYTETLWIWSQ
ncbi:transmembrane protein 135 [Ixodes scapularis]|uniref:transmembrane protein 135 n=1 Tax=Ixodes scapularis TaxID=6945 RepID=UPI001161941F|nr:transmembrane protein 135 [Ixodes scapularis]